jgi:hypothetical protein
MRVAREWDELQIRRGSADLTVVKALRLLREPGEDEPEGEEALEDEAIGPGIAGQHRSR